MKEFKVVALLLLQWISNFPTKSKGQTCPSSSNASSTPFGPRTLGWEFESCPKTAIPTTSTLPISDHEMFYIELNEASRRNTTNSTPCSFSFQINHVLEDMCSCKFVSQESSRSECIENTTCSSYFKINNTNSHLGICEEVLNSLGYSVCLIPYNSPANDSSGLYNARSLQLTVSQIEADLETYFEVLDRTVVGAYFRNEQHRCHCLDSYKKWLCSTRLKNLYMTPNSTSSCCNQLATIRSDYGTGVPLCPMKPCLGTCQAVVQNCPYYTPSSFQKDTSTRRNDTTELVYGGYPAFDCPRSSILQEMYSNGSCPRCTYFPDNCAYCIFDRGGAMLLRTVHTAWLLVCSVVVALMSL